MPEDSKDKVNSLTPGTIQFNVLGLAAFSVMLIVATGLLTRFLLRSRSGAGSTPMTVAGDQTPTRSDAERVNLVKALSRQSAVLVRLRIRPETDIDKVLGYWRRGIQVKDARPLLESVARLQDGGTVSLLYMLPKFARERLYTFPMLPNPGDPAMDCHWSTLNFFNDPPANLFTNASYMAALITSNYYQVAKPTLYGDIILMQDDSGKTLHSATYLAEDIVFTKNGGSFAQPWMLMRLADLLSRYTADAPAKMLV